MSFRNYYKDIKFESSCEYIHCTFLLLFKLNIYTLEKIILTCDKI